jgi:hypothetical protein
MKPAVVDASKINISLALELVQLGSTSGLYCPHSPPC